MQNKSSNSYKLFNLEGQVAIVTGSAGGIGLGCESVGTGEVEHAVRSRRSAGGDVGWAFLCVNSRLFRQWPTHDHRLALLCLLDYLYVGKLACI